MDAAAAAPPTLVSLLSGDECELIAWRLDLASAAALATFAKSAP